MGLRAFINRLLHGKTLEEACPEPKLSEAEMAAHFATAQEQVDKFATAALSLNRTANNGLKDAANTTRVRRQAPSGG